MKTTEAAAKVVAIDGCPLNCARKTLEQAGFTEFTHVQLADLGFAKGESPVTHGDAANTRWNAAAPRCDRRAPSRRLFRWKSRWLGSFPRPPACQRVVLLHPGNLLPEQFVFHGCPAPVRQPNASVAGFPLPDSESGELPQLPTLRTCCATCRRSHRISRSGGKARTPLRQLRPV